MKLSKWWDLAKWHSVAVVNTCKDDHIHAKTSCCHCSLESFLNLHRFIEQHFVTL